MGPSNIQLSQQDGNDSLEVKYMSYDYFALVLNEDEEGMLDNLACCQIRDTRQRRVIKLFDRFAGPAVFSPTDELNFRVAG